VDTAAVINRGTPQDVRRDVLIRCEILSRDGGFVFAPIHNHPVRSSSSEYFAAYNAVREFNDD
jgi:hypothetical protein